MIRSEKGIVFDSVEDVLESKGAFEGHDKRKDEIRVGNESNRETIFRVVEKLKRTRRNM